MSKPIVIEDTITAYPSGVLSDYAYASITSTENAYNPSSNTTYATINLTTGSNAVTYVYFTFDFSEIPAGSTIDSVSCSAKTYINTTNSSRITTRQAQLYSGSTAMGSASTISNSTTAYSMTPGTWTRDELQDASLRIYVQRGTSNTTTTYYVRMYGATFTVEYTFNGVAYVITASSSESAVTVDPASQDVLAGEEAEVVFNCADITGYEVTDNNVDVSSQLVRHTMPSGGTVDRDLGSYALVSGGFNGSGASYFQGLVGNGVDSTTTTSNYYSSGSGTIAVFTYDMSFTDIPPNATITRVWCEVNGHAESTSNSSEYMCAQLISGDDELSSELNFKSIGTSNSTQTLEASPVPTVAQLEEMKLQCRLGYYGGAINGATAYVTYTVPSGNPYYWTYTISNVSADHTILVGSSGPYIPDPEDPTKTYYSVTISSINATTDPTTGTTRVEENEDLVVTISPTDPQLTLALDNGVDITNQLVGGLPVNTYTVTTQVSGASYGFTLNSTTGYYVSTNNGVSKSASVARLNMDFESDCLVTIQYINYAEANYDYGMFGKLDTTVATDGLTAGSGSSSPSDSTSNYQLAMCSNSSSAQTISYQVPIGQHYIDIKYGKDDTSDANNDSLQWKVLSIEPTSAGGDYTYTLNDVNQKHSLIFVFGDVTFYYVNSGGNSACRIFPDGQQVVLDGGAYKINIVPNTTTDTVTLTDNGVDRTSLLEKEEGTDKQGNPAVSYSYSLSNIQANHTLVIHTGSTPTILYFKENNTWRSVTAAYRKINGTWVQEPDITTLFNSNNRYRKL